MKKTPLYETHIGLNAKIVPFAGWLMPVSYSSIIEEHRYCRTKTAIFDICHMGELRFKGNIAESGLENTFTQSLDSLETGRCAYGFILNDSGGIIDDSVVFKISPAGIMFVVNATRIEEDFKTIGDHIAGAELTDISGETAKIDLQGPLSRKVINDTLGIQLDIGFFRFKDFDIYGENVIISRTGYTGELGYEIFSGIESCKKIWEKLSGDDRVMPAGLGARDILRTEMGYCLYGSDIDEKTTPLEAGLGCFVNFNKDFTGKKALLEQKSRGIRHIRTGLKTLSRRAPRHDHRILFDNTDIGRITSGCFSPSLETGIGIGYVLPEHAEPGTKVTVEDERSRRIDAEITELPFQRKTSLKD
ncbi:MAG: glycine cleavage system aminomethyltransferase GcvT [Elusimicrobiota bacterium]